MDQLISCLVLDNNVLATLKTLFANSAISCDEKKRKAVAIQDVCLERMRNCLKVETRKRKLSPSLKIWA